MLQFFANLLSIVYLASNTDLFVLCGDFNARIGTKIDFIKGIDNISPRKSIDQTVNGHGNVFIEFLLESKLCVLNGRVTPQSDDFTFVSTRGKSVVDFIAVPHENIVLCKSLVVNTMSDLLKKYDLYHQSSENCKVSDHSVLTVVINIPMGNNNMNSKIEMKAFSPQRINKNKYNFNRICDSFMNFKMFKQGLVKAIEILEYIQVNQAELDNVYKKFVKTIFTEMDKHLLIVDCQSKSRKRFKYHKPYWNKELTLSWKIMRSSENSWKKYKGSKAYKRYLFNKF